MNNKILKSVFAIVAVALFMSSTTFSLMSTEEAHADWTWAQKHIRPDGTTFVNCLGYGMLFCTFPTPIGPKPEK
jgi:hypothetical protein